MRPYEAAVIFDASLEDTIIRETTDAVVEFVRSRGGAPGQVDRWGRRPFAYELKHRTEGYYVFIELNGEPALLAEVDRMLSLSDDVLRHRVIRQPDSPPSRPARGSRRRGGSPRPEQPALLWSPPPSRPEVAQAAAEPNPRGRAAARDGRTN